MEGYRVKHTQVYVYQIFEYEEDVKFETGDQLLVTLREDIFMLHVTVETFNEAGSSKPFSRTLFFSNQGECDGSECDGSECDRSK